MLAAMMLSLTASVVLAQRPLTWSAGALGGGWYAICTGLAQLLRDEAGLGVKVSPGGGARNPVLVDRGDAEIGMGLPPLLSAATRGDDPYRGKRMANLRALAGNMSLTVVHFYVAADSPFAKMSLDDIFRGRKPIRLAIPRPGSSDVWVLDKMMQFYGLCAPGKIGECYWNWETAGARFLRGTYAEQTRAFKDRKVDGAFAILALPAAAVTEASEGRALRLVALSRPLVDRLETFGLGRGAIPAGTYPRAVTAAEDVASATMGTTIVVSAAMSDDVAYTITKTINDNADRVRVLHPSLADYEPSRAWLNLGASLHHGAERYYRERGWLR
jgi:TRAP transporter TAXI family solute receptor